MVNMKFIEKQECAKCEYIKFDRDWDYYICSLEPEGINQYIGETKWQLNGDKSLKRCLK